MDAQHIKDAINTLGSEGLGGPAARAAWEIALQLALLNEHNARMEARYMELTDKAVQSSKLKVKDKKAKGPATHNS